MTLPRRIATSAEPATVRFRFAGEHYAGRQGESVAAALLAVGLRRLRNGPADGGARGAFCFMGACQECIVIIDGQRVEACRVPIADGLDIERVE